MTDQEKINSETNLKLAIQDAKFAIFMQELKEQREDIRRLNERQDADRKSLEEKMNSVVNQIHDTWRQTMLGVGGMIIALGALLFAALK